MSLRAAADHHFGGQRSPARRLVESPRRDVPAASSRSKASGPGGVAALTVRARRTRCWSLFTLAAYSPRPADGQRALALHVPPRLPPARNRSIARSRICPRASRQSGQDGSACGRGIRGNWSNPCRTAFPPRPSPHLHREIRPGVYHLPSSGEAEQLPERLTRFGIARLAAGEHRARASSAGGHRDATLAISSASDTSGSVTAATGP